MLVVMDIAAAQAPGAPWIAVGALLIVAALLLGGLAAILLVGRRADAPTPRSAPPSGVVVDDLPGFLDSPPGSTPTATGADGGFVTLTAPATPPAAPADPRRTSGRVLTAVAGLAVLLLAAAAVVAAGTRVGSRGGDGRTGQTERSVTAEARMTFAGLVLEERAVGVTVTYPAVELTSDGARRVARLTLPTWNCLSADAPDDPAAAGCVPGRTEYAELRSPALDVTRTHDGIRFTGDFPTSTRPAGSAPEPTGRTYRIEVSATADSELRPGNWSPAGGTLELEDRATESVDGQLRVDA
jgi:hypothetical protein